MTRPSSTPTVEAIQATQALIRRMQTANVPDLAALKTLRDERQKWVIERMLNEGLTFGEASGGALSFLTQPDALEYIHDIDNDLDAHVKIVANSFEEYVTRGEIPAPHYPWRICIILRRFKHTGLERSFLEAWCRHFPGTGRGRGYARLADRASKLGIPQNG